MSFSEKYNNFPVQIRLPVQWGEMDSFKHVNNIIYFRYFETVRIEYFRKMKIVGDDSSNIGPILASTDCKFIFPLSFPDKIVCTANVSETLQDRFIMKYNIFSTKYERLAATGTGVIVSYNYKSKTKAELPSWWIKNINSIESETG
jgi:acyl-CoA thioester hydrolase